METIDEILETVEKLFIVRNDCYPIQIDKTNDYIVEKKPLTKDIIKKHLDGLITIGCFQIEPGTNNVKWICFDFDGNLETELEKAKKLFNKLKRIGLHPYLEFSGRRGYHIWLFIEPIDASKARKFAIEISEDATPHEIFPKQDNLGYGKGYGAQVKLPLGKHRLSDGWSYFFNEQFQPLSKEESHNFLVNTIAKREKDDILIKDIKSFIKKETASWLEEQIRSLRIEPEKLDALSKIKEGVYNPSRPWSPLKLAFLHYVADIYTSIFSKIGYIKNMFYVDLFSGSGINCIEEKKELFLGSPLMISIKIPPSKQFSKMFFCEKDRKFSEALELRLEKTLEKNMFKVFPDDCNKAVDEIISELEKESYHSLIFIDPYSMEIKWKTMEKILNLQHSDIMFVFQTIQNPRGRMGMSFKEFFKNPKEASDIFEKLPEGQGREALLNFYIKEMIETRKNVEKNVLYETVRVSAPPNFYYDMIFLTRKTKGGSPWMDGVRQGKKQVENSSSTEVEKILDILKGKQKKLTNWL